MSLFDNIGSFLGDVFGGNNLLGGLVSTALTGLALNQVTKSINRDNDAVKRAEQTPEPDRGVRLQVAASTDNAIPVLYGTAVCSGIITEAVQSNNAKTMTYVLTISERTGNLLSTGAASAYQLQDVFWGDNRIVFAADGITASYTVDRQGNVDRNIAGLVRVYFYAGNSTLGQQPVGSGGATPNAWSVVPGWTAAMNMTDLVFAVVSIDYNRERGVTSLPDVKFRISNSMTLPGDCLLDYMTNSRYGAGIPAEDILSG